MTYRVYQSDINAGLAGEPCYCPVARSIKRRHPGATVHVGGMFVDIGEHEYILPERIRNWIEAYDGGAQVRPTRFELLSPTR